MDIVTRLRSLAARSHHFFDVEQIEAMQEAATLIDALTAALAELVDATDAMSWTANSGIADAALAKAQAALSVANGKTK